MHQDNDARLPPGVAERILQRTTEGVLVSDHRHRIHWVNEAFTRITGYPLAEVQGQPMTIFRSGHHDSAFYEAIYNTLMHEGFWEGEMWRRCRNGELCPMFVNVTRIDGQTPEDTYYVDFIADLADYKRHERRVEFLVGHDALTELPNRVLLQDRLAGALNRAHRHDRGLAVLFADLDNLKEVNDTFGHPAGDALLCEAASRLRSAVREEDTVARLSGDEFVVLLENLNNREDVNPICEGIHRGFAAPLEYGENRLRMAISIGISHYPEDGADADTLLAHADAAMYRAKRTGGDHRDTAAHPTPTTSNSPKGGEQ